MPTRPADPARSLRRLPLYVALLAATVLSGQTCVPTPTPGQQKAQPVALDTLQKQRYVDLRHGPFLSLVDFEGEQVPAGIAVIGGPPPAGTLPALEPEPSGPASAPASAPADAARPAAWLSSVAATGLHSLAWRVTADRDALRIGELRQRDWSGYALLLLSVYSPANRGAISIEIPSTRSVGQVRWRSVPQPLHRGWNLVRIELAEVADLCDLADISAVWVIWHAGERWPKQGRRSYDLHPDSPVASQPADPLADATLAASAPADGPGSDVLLLDDLLLADNTRWVLGAPDSPSGAPYVCYRGTHLWVGIKHQQEVGIQAGRITHCYDLRRDPDRALNLAGEGGLGPIPLPVAGGDSPIPGVVRPGPVQVPTDPAEPWLPLGASVLSDAVILEATPLRTVVQASLKFRPADNSVPAEPILWRYWFYPDGRILTAVRLPAVRGPFNSGGNLLAWSVSDALPGRTLLRANTEAATNQPAWAWRFADGQGRGGPTDRPPAAHGVLVAASLLEPLALVPDAATGRLHSVWAGFPSTSSAVAYSQLLLLTAPPYADFFADRTARHYGLPVKAEVLVGQVAADARWDMDHNGFAEMEGVLNFDPQDGQLRVRLVTPDEPRDPVYIRVRNLPADAALHIALDGQLLHSGPLTDPTPNVARDSDGHLLIRLPRPISATPAELDVRVVP